MSHPHADQQPGQIASTRSARVAASRKLLRRSARRTASAFLADGPQAVREALTYHRADEHPNDLRVQVAEVYVDAQLTSRHAELLSLADEAGIRVVTCDVKAIASLSEAVTPQGIVARCAFLDLPLTTLLAHGPAPSTHATVDAGQPHTIVADGHPHTIVTDGHPHTIVTDGRRPVETSQAENVDHGHPHTIVDDGRRPVETSQAENVADRHPDTSQAENVRQPGPPRLIAVPLDVRDPGNLGTIIRCADAAGADGVAILGDSVDLYNAKTVRSTAGSIFHVPVAIEPDPVAGISALRAAGLQIVATEGTASTDLDQFIDDGGLTAPTAWLFGNEAHGLPEEIAALADVRISIPIRGLAESLNLSTAAAVCLFASARAHR